MSETEFDRRREAAYIEMWNGMPLPRTRDGRVDRRQITATEWNEVGLQALAGMLEEIIERLKKIEP